MLQGQSTFSGLGVPRGSGLHLIQNDSKVVFTANKKERSFLKIKLSARNVKWTEPSRAFFKKNHNVAKVEKEIYTITKKVRGFNLIPKTIVEKTVNELKPKNKIIQKNEKVYNNSNSRY